MNIFKQIKNYRILRKNRSEMTNFDFKSFLNTPIKDACLYRFTCKLSNQDIDATKVFLHTEHLDEEAHYIYISEANNKQNPQVINGFIAKQIYYMMQEQFLRQKGLIK